MKINIQIEDATPEELQRIIGMTPSPTTAAPARIAESNHNGGGEKNFQNPGWSPEERDSIRLCKSGQEALSVYREKFPGHARARSAIRRQWSKLHCEVMDLAKEAPADKPADGLPVVTGCEECLNGAKDLDQCDSCSPPLTQQKEVVPVAEKKPRETNQYGIPKELFGTDKKQYQRLWARCKVQGINYTEALAQEGVLKRGKRPGKKTVDPAEKKPRKSPVAKERLPFHQTQPDGAASSGANPQVITSGPKTSPPSTSTVYQLDKPLALSGLQLKIGDKVRQTRGTRIMSGDGEIKRAPQGSADVLVAFSNGQEWINRNNLAPVPAGSA